MADAQKKYYLKYIPKEQLQGFLENLKKALAEGKKSGEKRELEIEVRGSKDDPTGISIEQFSLDKDKFSEYFDLNAEHLKKALVCCTINFEVKEDKDVDAIKAAFEQIKPIILGIPLIAAKKDKFEFHLRNNGKKIGIDLISVEGKIVQSLLDLGVNLSEYHHFCFALKTGANLGKLFTEGANPSDDLLKELFNFLICLKSSGENIKYLSTALLSALKEVNIEEEKKKKGLHKFMGFLNLVNAFICGKLKLEFDSSVLNKSTESFPGGTAGFKAKLGGFHQMALGMGQSLIKPAVSSMGFDGPLKTINLDTITIAAGVPKYQNGLALSIKIPGLTKVVEEILK